MPVALPCGNHIRISIIRLNPAIALSCRASFSTSPARHRHHASMASTIPRVRARHRGAAHGIMRVAHLL